MTDSTEHNLGAMESVGTELETEYKCSILSSAMSTC